MGTYIERTLEELLIEWNLALPYPYPVHHD